MFLNSFHPASIGCGRVFSLLVITVTFFFSFYDLTDQSITYIYGLFMGSQAECLQNESSVFLKLPQ